MKAKLELLNFLSDQGKFYRDFVNFSETQYDKIRTTGSSTLTKALAMPMTELTALINWAKDGRTNAEIVERVESHIVSDLQLIADGTYVTE